VYGVGVVVVVVGWCGCGCCGGGVGRDLCVGAGLGFLCTWLGGLVVGVCFWYRVG